MVAKTVRYSAHTEKRAKEYAANLDALDFGRRVLSCIRKDCGRTAVFRGRVKAELDGWRPEHAPAGAPNARNWICPDCSAIDEAHERDAQKERAGILAFLRAKCAELSGKDLQLIETAIMRITVGRHADLDPLEHRAAGAYIKLRATLSNQDESSIVFCVAESVASGSYRIPTPIQIELYPEHVIE
jgi:hypothetical protein